MRLYNDLCEWIKHKLKFIYKMPFRLTERNLITTGPMSDTILTLYDIIVDWIGNISRIDYNVDDLNEYLSIKSGTYIGIPCLRNIYIPKDEIWIMNKNRKLIHILKIER